MQNLTIALEESLLCAAQEYAVQHGTTLNQILQAYLVQLTAVEPPKSLSRLEERWSQGGNGQKVVTMDENEVARSFRFVEEPIDSPSTETLPEDSSCPFDTTELPSPQLDQQIAAMFKQVLSKSK